MLEHAIYSVISPEGCASILWKDASQMEQAAEALHLTAPKLLEIGVIDSICEEPLGGAHSDHQGIYERVESHLDSWLETCFDDAIDERLESRYQKFRMMGIYSEVG